jgi:hypothetical protein
MLLLQSMTLYPFGSIAATLPVKTFDLTSFYFGCVLDTHANLPPVDTACIITVTGYYAKGGLAPAQTYSFTPTKGLQADQLARVTLPASYAGLLNVTFGVADVLAAATVLIVDDLAHCNHV